MSLTAQQLVDARYYCGYSVTGNAALSQFRELAYSDVSYLGISLDLRLANLSTEEEFRMTTYFLPNLALREAEIQTASTNLDTAIAAVWTRNRDEVGDRMGLFKSLRMSLCHFLGFPPGSGLVAGNKLVRS